MVTRHLTPPHDHGPDPKGLKVAVLGAGLAGASIARVLARSGTSVTVLDAAPEPATGASGNPIGILHPLISKDHNLASQWVEHGMQMTLSWLSELTQILGQTAGQTSCDLTRQELPIGGISGVLELNDDATDLVCWSPEGAWIRPKAFVSACLADAVAHGAVLEFNREVSAVSPTGDVRFQDGELRTFDHVVICVAQRMSLLLPKASLSLNSIRGTVTSYAIDPRWSLPCVICADGYATPIVDGQMVVGASFERISDDPAAEQGFADDRFTSQLDSSDAASEVSLKTNLDRLRLISPTLAEHCATVAAQDRTSIRSATLDRMPHVGRVLDPQATLTPQMSQLHHMPRCDRLWVLGGLGARGLSSAPLGAAVVASLMLGRPPPVPPRLVNAVDPVRFALRRHQRRK